MAGLLDVVSASEPAQSRANVANAFIATVYFKQATDLLNQGEYAEAEGYFREVLRILPDHSGALNNLGTAVWRQKRLREAEAYHRRAQVLAPADYAILNNLGIVCWDLHRCDEAIEWYRRAIEIRPDLSQPMLNLGVALSDVGEFEEAGRWLHESLRLQPDLPGSHVSLGNLLMRQGDLDGASDCVEQALRIRPDFAEARRARAYLLLARGEYARAWPEHEWRLKCPELLVAPVNSPRWAGEDLAERSILLVAEQGLGDTLQFIRFATKVKERNGHVVVACRTPLLRIVARCPGVDRVVDEQATRPECDVHLPLLSVPAVLGTTIEGLPVSPYLSVNAEIVEKWRPVLDRAAQGHRAEGGATAGRIFKIGIAWQGNRDHRADRLRSFPLRHYAHLAELPGVRLINLQKGDGTEQLTELGGRFSVGQLTPRAKDDEDDRRDLLDTAAVMTQLDLVITPDSSLAHLAGGLGVRVWVPLSTAVEWRWMIDRDDSPWYPSLRLFRQTKFGDWDEVFRRMADVLRQELTS
jgi:Tfp pilus assembly protein PilF